MKKVIILTSAVLMFTTSLLAYSSNEPVATCSGSSSCKACKNCKYCKHCAKDGGTCGVCK